MSESKSDVLPFHHLAIWSGKRDLNPQQSAWKAETLPIELFPQMVPEPRFERGTYRSQGDCTSRCAIQANIGAGTAM